MLYAPAPSAGDKSEQHLWDVLEPTGDPAKTIEQIVEEGTYDTVVLGSRGLGTAARVLQGSVSEHDATHTKATVVIVH